MGLSEDDDDDDDAAAPAGKRAKVAQEVAEVEHSIVEKILAMRIGKRPKVNEDAPPPPPPPPEPLVEPDTTTVVSENRLMKQMSFLLSVIMSFFL